ncbi:hypothetical protein RJ641_027064 [Dillenia turbinata]|uniref:Uncharacterized protein n=1 Tax=Dillenia turbinata TaxID=194707 RepID=A0AAN8ZLB6_9MAGN
MESIRSICIPVYTTLRKTTAAFTITMGSSCWGRNIHFVLLSHTSKKEVLAVYDFLLSRNERAKSFWNLPLFQANTSSCGCLQIYISC